MTVSMRKTGGHVACEGALPGELEMVTYRARGFRADPVCVVKDPLVSSGASRHELVSQLVVAWVDLYWLPLGAGGHSVRLNGRVYEAVAARLERRPMCDLYHSALEVHVPEGRFIIEQAPVRDARGAERGVVAGGAVGRRWAGHFRIFRYEVRCWRDGVIPDIVEAVASPVRLSDDPRQAQRLLDLVPSVPTPVWGRDELDAGEMWNSNSVISWLIARSGMAAETIRMPSGGRAPGWEAGLVVARRQLAHTSPPCGETAATIRDHDDDIEDVKEGH